LFVDFFEHPPKSDEYVLLLNLTIQLYGSLLVGQSVLVYYIRSHLFTPHGTAQPYAKRLRFGVCLTYTIVFSLSFILTIKAIIQSVFSISAIMHAMLFLSMAAAYAFLTIRSSQVAPKRLAL
jgi:hypothetical protein